jgi:hypothetical protein
MFTEIQPKIDMKKPPVPFASMGELLYSANDKERAVKAIRKVPDVEVRIQMLMSYKCWEPCVQEMQNSKDPGRWVH